MDTISSFIHTETPDADLAESCNAPLPTRLRMLPCVIFFVMVIGSMAAAAVVTEAPLIVVGLY